MSNDVTMRQKPEARATASVNRSFAHVLGLEVSVAIIIGTAYALTVGRHLQIGLDATWYMLVAGSLASGDGYSNPVQLYAHGIKTPTANFPPGYPLFLAGLHDIGINTPTGFQIAGAFCGGATVLMTGLLGRSLSGRDSVGLVAGGLAAVSPALVATDGSIMSETIAVPLTAAVLLASIWASRSSSLWRWAAVGALAGGLSLVRSEDVMTAVVLVPFVILLNSSVPLRRRLARGATAVVAAGLIVSPWVVRNSETFKPAVLLSTNDGKTFAGANCGPTYQGPLIGYWDDACLGHDQLANSNEGKYDEVLRAEGADYVRSHLIRVPLVVGVRILRAWGLFNPLQQARLEASQTRSVGFQQISWAGSLLLLVLAIPGLARSRTNRIALVLVGGPVVLATVVVALTFGNPRYVLQTIPSLCVGAAFTLVALVDRWSSARLEPRA